MNRKKNYPALFLLCVLALIPAGCGGSSPESGVKEVAKKAVDAASTAVDAAVEAAKSNPLTGVKGSFQKFLDAKSFRAKMETNAEGRVAVTNMEFVAPDRYHMTNPQMEMILIGGDYYMRPSGGPWRKIAAGMQDVVKSFRSKEMMEQFEKATEVKFLKPDMYEGKPALVYEYTSTDMLGMKGKSVSKTWVDAIDGLPRKSEFTGDYGGMKSSGVITWYDFGSDIKIEPPTK